MCITLMVKHILSVDENGKYVLNENDWKDCRFYVDLLQKSVVFQNSICRTKCNE